MRHPDWTRDAAIYQLNQRQLTEEGTFRAAEAELPRIRDLGVDIIWLMPVHPIGEVNRKGALGSPYAVRDYLAVNPEFGTEDDLRHFVAPAHGLGLKVILDWVANHTAWDNDLTRRHPEWYARDWKGDFRPTPWWDWDDIIDLDYDQPGLRGYMAEALGTGCGSAASTATAATWPVSCRSTSGRTSGSGWTRSSRSSCSPSGRPATCTPAPSTRRTPGRGTRRCTRLASGTATSSRLRVYYAWNERSWPDDAMRMTFVSNHDHNHALGHRVRAVRPGAGCRHGAVGRRGGHPAGLHRAGARQPPPAGVLRQGRRHGDDPHQAELYRHLFALKKATPALWNGGWGGRMVRVPNDGEEHVLSFVRTAGRAGCSRCSTSAGSAGRSASGRARSRATTGTRSTTSR